MESALAIMPARPANKTNLLLPRVAPDTPLTIPKMAPRPSLMRVISDIPPCFFFNGQDDGLQTAGRHSDPSGVSPPAVRGRNRCGERLYPPGPLLRMPMFHL